MHCAKSIYSKDIEHTKYTISVQFCWETTIVATVLVISEHFGPPSVKEAKQPEEDNDQETAQFKILSQKDWQT